MSKPIICVDFDGVIHSYENGWQGGEIYGTATPGFFNWAIRAMEHFRLVVYSSRSKTPEGITAMREAIGKWSVDAICRGEVGGDFDWGDFFPYLEFSDVKPPAFLTIDDRAICFLGDWNALNPKELLDFKTWTQFKCVSTGLSEDQHRQLGQAVAEAMFNFATVKLSGEFEASEASISFYLGDSAGEIVGQWTVSVKRTALD